MGNLAEVLLSWQFIIFGLGIVAITSVISRFTEYVFNIKKYAKRQKIWKELMLPTLPVILGSLLAYCITSYPYPVGLETSGARFVFGLVAGLLSTLIYRIVKSFLNKSPVDNV